MLPYLQEAGNSGELLFHSKPDVFSALNMILKIVLEGHSGEYPGGDPELPGQ
jgi:hypothetical protein